MPSFLLSAISSMARSKGSPRRSKPSSGSNAISGLRFCQVQPDIQSWFRVIDFLTLGEIELIKRSIAAQEVHP